jgi:hypothetical protein
MQWLAAVCVSPHSPEKQSEVKIGQETVAT